MNIYHLDNRIKVNFDLRIKIANVVFLGHSEQQALYIAPTVNDEYHSAAAYITTNGDPYLVAVEIDSEWVLAENRHGETFDFTGTEISVLETSDCVERDRMGEWRERIAGWMPVGVKATITECGNGLPNLGELCYDSSTDTVYKIIGWDGSDRISTNGPGCGNSVNVLLKERGSASETTNDEWEAIKSSNYQVSVED